MAQAGRMKGESLALDIKQDEERTSVTLENEGKRIFGVLHKPLSVSPCPIVFFCHGFAGNKCGRHRMYVNLAKKFSEIGIASLRIDFRGSGDSEGELIDMTLDSEVSDGLLALKYIEKLPFIDSSRIGIFGRSLGGAVAIMLARRYGKAKSLALWAPVFHAEQWKEDWHHAKTKISNNIPLDLAMRVNGHVAGEGFVKQLFEMSLEKELRELEKVPLLHLHGEKDMTVKIDHANHYLSSRKNSMEISRFLKIPHADHDFTLIEVQRHAIKETCQWFKETL